tara:strand:- start:246 stop:1082 length:837 start_codon:yes stop_codon:yes gene_type:complete
MDLGVYIVATPIGNLQDISFRAIEIIKCCDIIICENPKHSLKLLNKFGIKKKLYSLHDYNENSIIQKISNDLYSKIIVLISDAGSPLISDPGYKFINYCIKNDVKVTTIPGPNSIIPALQLSGIPINEFCFAGFFPKTKNLMAEFINNLKSTKKTSAFFVSSHKLLSCLDLLEAHIKDRTISISKELTKINEKTFRGLSHELKPLVFKDEIKPKGEYVIVVEGNSSKKTQVVNMEDYNEDINKMLSKFSLTDVVEIVHKLSGIKKNKVYKWVLKLKKS